MRGPLVTVLMLSLPAMLCVGCANTNPSAETFCLAAYPVYLSDKEYLEDVNARKVQAMDLYGQLHCGWQ